MGRSLRAFCVYCDKEVREGDPFCRRCRRPTSWASAEQRAAWELEEWKNGRRPALVPLAEATPEPSAEATPVAEAKPEAVAEARPVPVIAKPEPVAEQKPEGTVVPMPARVEAVEAPVLQRASGDGSVAMSEETVRPSEPVITTAPLKPATLEPVPNGNGNGNGSHSNRNGSKPAEAAKVEEPAAALPSAPPAAPVAEVKLGADIKPVESAPLLAETKNSVEAAASAPAATPAPNLSAPSNGGTVTVPAVVASAPAPVPSTSPASNGSPVTPHGSHETKASNGGNGNGSHTNGGNGNGNAKSSNGTDGSTGAAKAATPTLHPRTPGPTYPLVIGSQDIAASTVEEKRAPMPAQPPVDDTRVSELKGEVSTLKDKIASLEGELKAAKAAAKRPLVEASKIVASAPEQTAEETGEAAARAKALTAYAMGAPFEMAERGPESILAQVKRILIRMIEIRDK